MIAFCDEWAWLGTGAAHLPLIQQAEADGVLPHANKAPGAIYGVQDPVLTLQVDRHCCSQTWTATPCQAAGGVQDLVWRRRTSWLKAKAVADNTADAGKLKALC